ncbi:hypothetical protein GCM10020256_31700 [Streptomyces thermocoprophilus]
MNQAASPSGGGQCGPDRLHGLREAHHEVQDVRVPVGLAGALLDGSGHDTSLTPTRTIRTRVPADLGFRPAGGGYTPA